MAEIGTSYTREGFISRIEQIPGESFHMTDAQLKRSGLPGRVQSKIRELRGDGIDMQFSREMAGALFDTLKALALPPTSKAGQRAVPDAPAKQYGVQLRGNELSGDMVDALVDLMVETL